MQTLEPLLARQEFFQDLEPEYLSLLVECASNVRFADGTYLFREGEPARQFFLLREGKVALEIAAPGRGHLVVQTLGGGGVVGVSWLFPPYQYQFDARAVTPVRALALDGVCLRGHCEQDPRLGYALMQRFTRIAVQRLQAARLQLLDVYGRTDAG